MYTVPYVTPNFLPYILQAVVKIANQFLKPDAVKILIGESDRLTANAAVTQKVRLVEEKAKISTLITLVCHRLLHHTCYIYVQ